MNQKKSILHIFFLFSVVTAFAATDGTSVFGALTDGHYTLSSQTYTLTDDVNTASYIYVPAGVTATIDLTGYTIDRGLTSEMTNGSVIIVEGTLTITDASTGGKIQGGYDAGDGYGYSTSCVKVLEGATFNLQGGTLIGRVQDYDYTVSVVDNSNFTMTGGKITGGRTGVLAVGNVTLTGGEISGNNIGVRVGKNFSISGNPVITGNTVMNADLSYSGGIRKINITGALTDGANIGITVLTPTDNSPVTVTSGYNTYNSVSPDTYFSLDNDGQIQTSPFDYMTVVMGWNEDRTEVAVGTALYTVNFDMNGHGDAIEAVSLLSGYKVAEPTEPTADDWFFVDWFTDDAYTAQWNFDNTVTSNMTLHARWTQEAIYSIILPENMVIVSTTNALVGGKYPVGTEIKFKLSSEDYVVDGDVKNGDDVLTTDGDGNYTVTMGDADLTITAMVKKAVEPNKTLSGSESYTAQDGDVLTGSTSGAVTIANNAKITLSDVTITGGIVCEGTADITLVGTNSVTGASLKAGIQVGGSGTTLTIKGNGSLTANGGSQSAGIGLSRAWDVDAMGGDIVIEGGNITATGDNFGAGIGTGVSYGNGTDNTATIGNITIKGGTVKAIGGTNQFTPGSGIGKGGAYANGHAVVGTITIYDDIDMVDASSISENIVYMHETTDVTESKADYFTIGEDGNRRLIVQKTVIADIPDQTFTGSVITPEPQVTIGSLSLTKGSDYVYSYCDNTNAGTAKVTVTFKGDYASLGSLEKEFTIAKATPNVTTPTAVENLVFNGNEQELVTAGDTDFGTVLYSLDGTNYSEKVPKGTNAGKYTVYYKVDTDNYYYAPQKVEVTIAESYTITWKNGDEILETDNYVPSGATPEYNGEIPTKPMDDDYTYTFSGWSPEISSVEEDIIYTAQFTATARRGDCGANATWCFDPDTGKLTISGTGAMYNYDYGVQPWYGYKDNITSVEIENGVTSISEYAFYCCTSLKSVEIPDSVDSIGNSAFSGCESLTSVTIPDSVESIGRSTFYCCTSLSSITIPVSVTSIGKEAFNGCTNITDVYCYAAPANLTWNDGDCDDFKSGKETVCHVPAEHIDDYNAKFGTGSDYPVNVRFVGDLVDMGLGEHLYGHSITLDGGIGVNFYVELTDELLASENAEMVFTVPNGSKTDTQTLLVKDVIADESNKVVIGSKTYYKFRCNVSAKDMASTITAQLVDGESKGKEYTYSVKDYAEYILEHNEVEEYANAAPLVKAMLNYGAASQSYFGIGGTAANASLTDEEKALCEVSIDDVFKFNVANVTLPEGVTFEGATLSLKSETTLSLYFKGLPADTKFTCDGKTVETARNGDYVVARIRGIKASELENNFTVKFGESSETYNVTYNVMTYCYNVLNDSTVDDNLQNVCKALYKYAQAAKTYSE